MVFSKLWLISGLSLLLVACSSSEKINPVVTLSKPAATTSIDHHATVKPGAAIALSQTMPESMTSGGFNTINLQFEEAYDDGDMQVSLLPAPGLEIFGQTTEKSFLMKNAANHDWPIDVKAEEDGIYFISVFTTATNPDLNFETRRSFSIRVDIGNITPEMTMQAFPENGRLSADGKTRALEAVETIK